jgi:hypothetical protein
MTRIKKLKTNTMKKYNNYVRIIGHHAKDVGEILATRGLNEEFSPFDLPIEVATKDSIKEFDTDLISIEDIVINPEFTKVHMTSNHHPCNELLVKIYRKWNLLLKIENEFHCPDDHDKGGFKIDIFGTKHEE